jgi:hypothetical protein
MSYCESCGHELRARAAFCQACGARVETSPTAGAQVPPAPPGSVGSPQGYASAPASPPPYAGTPAAAAPYPAGPYGAAPAAPAAPSAGGTSGGIWLVIIGAIISVLFTCVYVGVSWSSGYSGSTWTHGANVVAWTNLVRPGLVFYGVGSWSPHEWFTQLAWLASMLTTILCIVAAILALLRGTAGARVSGGLIQVFGILAAVASILYIIAWLTYPDYPYLGLTDIAGLVGNILIIIGGGMMGRAPAPPAGAWMPPSQGSGVTY